MDKSVHWSVNLINTKQRNINFIVGERGVGKTFSTLLFCVNRALKYDEEFIYMRRRESELQTVKELLNPLQTEGYFEGIKFEVKGYDFYADGKIIGHWAALSTSNQFKGTAFPKVKYLIYDEFLSEKGTTKELKRETHKFLNFLETVFRMRDFTVYCLANATTFECCYKYDFNLMLPFGDNEFWYHPTKSILVQLVHNEPYREAKMESPLGHIIKGTTYEDYAVRNSFYMDSYVFVKKRSGSHYRILSFSYKGQIYGIYISKKERYMVIDTTTKCYPDFQIKDIDMTEEGVRLLSGSQHPVFRYMRNYFNQGQLCFQTMRIKTELYELLSRIL